MQQELAEAVRRDEVSVVVREGEAAHDRAGAVLVECARLPPPLEVPDLRVRYTRYRGPIHQTGTIILQWRPRARSHGRVCVWGKEGGREGRLQPHSGGGGGERSGDATVAGGGVSGGATQEGGEGGRVDERGTARRALSCG